MTPYPATAAHESLTETIRVNDGQLHDLAQNTEQRIDQGDIQPALTDIIAQGRDLTIASREQVIGRVSELTDSAIAELGRGDRRQVSKLARRINKGEPTAEIRDRITGLNYYPDGINPRSVGELLLLGARPDEFYEHGTMANRSDSIKDLLSGAMDAPMRRDVTRHIIYPEVVQSIAVASIGLYSGSAENLPSTHVSIRHPFNNVPELAEDSFLKTVAKYWMLGGAASSVMWGEPSANIYLSYLPDSQRPAFLDLAKEINEVRLANFWERYTARRDNVRAGRDHTAQDGQPPRGATPPADSTEPTEAQRIILSVHDEASRRTLSLSDTEALQETIDLVHEMRAASPGISDRQIYLAVRMQLDSPKGTHSEADLAKLTEQSKLLLMLMSGDVSKNATLPPRL